MKDKGKISKNDNSDRRPRAGGDPVNVKKFMKNNKICDGCSDGGTWSYSPEVRDHFLSPRNILLDETNYRADGVGSVMSPVCGDITNVWIKVNKKTKKITECRWRAFGCASSVASASMMSVIVTENGGMTIDKAMKLKPEQIVKRLGGLPERKFHCSVLGNEALKDAIKNYLINNTKTVKNARARKIKKNDKK